VDGVVAGPAARTPVVMTRVFTFVVSFVRVADDPSSETSLTGLTRTRRYKLPNDVTAAAARACYCLPMICFSGVANDAVDDIPAVHGNLTGDDERGLVVTVLDDFEQIAHLIGAEGFGPPIIQDEPFGARQGAQAGQTLCTASIFEMQKAD
jgi:hypothetical protein